MLRANNDLNHVWIGLSDTGHQNYYEKWSDGSATTFTRWDRNRPKNREGIPIVDNININYHAEAKLAKNGNFAYLAIKMSTVNNQLIAT